MTLEDLTVEIDALYTAYTAEIIEAGAKFGRAIDELAEKSKLLPESSQELIPSILAIREKKMEAEITAATK